MLHNGSNGMYSSMHPAMGQGLFTSCASSLPQVWTAREVCMALWLLSCKGYQVANSYYPKSTPDEQCVLQL